MVIASTRELFSDLRTAVSVSFSAAMAAVLPQDPRNVENRGGTRERVAEVARLRQGHDLVTDPGRCAVTQPPFGVQVAWTPAAGSL